MDAAELDRRFTALYRQHVRDVYSFAYYRLGNHYDAEDLTEQVFLQAWRNFERALASADGRPMRPWLIKIAANLAINQYRDRANKPQVPIDDSESLADVHETADIVESRAGLQEILGQIATLPDDRREALIMRFALGMDNREIARATGRTDGAVKVLIHRALKQLEGAMTGEQ